MSSIQADINTICSFAIIGPSIERSFGVQASKIIIRNCVKEIWTRSSRRGVSQLLMSPKTGVKISNYKPVRGNEGVEMNQALPKLCSTSWMDISINKANRNNLRIFHKGNSNLLVRGRDDRDISCTNFIRDKRHIDGRRKALSTTKDILIERQKEAGVDENFTFGSTRKMKSGVWDLQILKESVVS